MPLFNLSALRASSFAQEEFAHGAAPAAAAARHALHCGLWRRQSAHWCSLQQYAARRQLAQPAALGRFDDGAPRHRALHARLAPPLKRRANARRAALCRQLCQRAQQGVAVQPGRCQRREHVAAQHRRRGDHVHCHRGVERVYDVLRRQRRRVGGASALKQPRHVLSGCTEDEMRPPQRPLPLLAHAARTTRGPARTRSRATRRFRAAERGAIRRQVAAAAVVARSSALSA
jgi:hypothetical protein